MLGTQSCLVSRYFLLVHRKPCKLSNALISFRKQQLSSTYNSAGVGKRCSTLAVKSSNTASTDTSPLDATSSAAFDSSNIISEQNVSAELQSILASRYTDTTFHSEDGLDPNEWALVYRIPNEREHIRYEYAFYATAVGCIALGIAVVAKAISDNGNPFAIGPGFMLIGVILGSYAIRLRRYAVIRMYSWKDAQMEYEHWSVLQKIIPAKEGIYIPPPIRHYRIIWQDLSHKKRVFDFNSYQVSDKVERKRKWAVALNGNFLVLGRPWAVHRQFFMDDMDYVLVRKR